MSMQTLTRSGAGVLIEPTHAADASLADRLHELLDQYRFVVVRGGLSHVDDAVALLSHLGRINEASTRVQGQVLVEPNQDAEVFRSNSPLPLHKDGILTGFDVTVVGIFCVEFRHITDGRTYVSDANVALERLNPADVALLRENGVEGMAVDNSGYYRSDYTESWHPFPAFKALPGREPTLNLGLPHRPGEPESWRLRVAGVDEETSERILLALRGALLNDLFVYFHQWHEGDLLIMDNYEVLHGREGFEGSHRRLANIQVLKD